MVRKQMPSGIVEFVVVAAEFVVGVVAEIVAEIVVAAVAVAVDSLYVQEFV
jgi:hypothetical protein